MIDTGIDHEDHRRVMGALAACKAEALDKLFAGVALPSWRYLRKPETGLVMLRGRISGKGARFNLGEATVTRAAVVLSGGQTGHAYALGRDRRKAEQSALLHALWQCADRREEIERDILEPLARTAVETDETRTAETAATKVDFFTLVRGDSE